MEFATLTPMSDNIIREKQLAGLHPGSEDEAAEATVLVHSGGLMKANIYHDNYKMRSIAKSILCFWCLFRDLTSLQLITTLLISRSLAAD